MKFDFRKLLAGLVVVAVVAIVFFRGDQLVALAETMKRGLTFPLIFALCLQLGKYAAQSFTYVFCFRSVGESVSAKTALSWVFGTFFMNTLAPSLNLAGMTLVVDDARRRGIDPGKSSSAALLMQITVDSAFTLFMIIGFVVVVLFYGFSPLWFLPGLVVLCLVGGMVAIMVLGLRKPELLMKILIPIERLANKVLKKLKRDPLSPWAQNIADRFSEAARLIVEHPYPAFKAFACSFGASLCELSCFCLVGLAFGVKSMPVLLCGYVIATLFAMVSVTPQGVGFVEAAVALAFAGFGQNPAAGTAVGIVYRGIVFWLPFLIGAVLINNTKTFQGSSRSRS